ncbi:MAG: ABC transporter ATP-binding protein [Rhodospirillales bacterium]|jgi:lipoprotein-releasing system ATP-binding protein|nr:ABC transporter ATP-binding protein [Rhodospirillales bacterium]MBT4005979.1 ABC transporter ATP-binding protein [Rhodospirillales bacterium]MBT5112722.1 ABC transporter ATP-binding protein [Rhodospirillales bacterium]MBT5673492.1 ABC transporter ATP-binding protein [Rhodospirillales bacterium]MBT6186151.1 ABC transporter ATP-binding protein [Rhodospirillales bacterium]
MSDAALKLSGIKRGFREGDARLEVLTGVDLEIQPGEIIALTGVSGSGKSTLLHIAGLLEKADSGEISLAGVDVTTLSEAARTQLRARHLGFVYQFHHLLPEFSAEENIMLPGMIAGKARADALARARELLGLVGLEARALHRPSELSGGEQQRVAIARALTNAPSLLLADEPTGNLDPGTAQQVFDLLLTVVKGTGRAALIATHNTELAARMDRTIAIEDGKLIET